MRALLLAFFLFACGVGAQPSVRDAPAPPLTPQAATPIETRAILRSVTDEEGHLYVHLKILPRAKLPFTTIRFRVRDRALLAGLHEGTSVKFRAERIDGENALVTIRAVPPCERFQPCD